MNDKVRFDTIDGVALLTLNRPAKLNALDFELLDQLMRRLDDVEVADEVTAVVLTGAGTRAFSAGADIVEFRDRVKDGRWPALHAFVGRGQAVTLRLERYSKPTVAAVNGLAYGGGCELVEAVHLALASKNATFAKPEIKLGMPPTFGGTQRLPRLIGRRRALEMLLLGEHIEAREALAVGLVNEVVAHDDLLAAAIDLARRLGGQSAPASRAILHSVRRGLDTNGADGMQIEAEEFGRLVPTTGLSERLDGWLNRRSPPS